MALHVPIALLLWSLAIVDPSAREVRFSDIPEALRLRFAANEFEFGVLRDDAKVDTSSRLEAADHASLAFFLLESNSFTSRAPIDPAELARQTAAQDFKPTVFVRARIRDLLAALEQPAEQHRLTYWQTHLPPEKRTAAVLESYLREALDGLYAAQPAAGASRIGRTLPSDTSLASSFAISGAVTSLSRLDPDLKVENVLVIGPGQDFAPAVNFHDEIPPQSYEPYLTADALLSARLADERFLSIRCFDINDRVLHFVEEFKRSAAPKLILPSEPGSQPFNAWFDASGRAIGIASADAYRRTINVRPSLARKVTAERLNIVTERLAPSPEYDLVVVMDVLGSFREKQMGLALANIQSMLRPGGYLVHNDARPEAAELANLLEMPQTQRGSVNAASRLSVPFFIHRRR